MSDKKLIFIVDDSEIFTALMAKSVSNAFEVEVKTYPTGEKMMADLKMDPDLILLDYYLDHGEGVEAKGLMNGKEVLDQINNFGQNTPVVIVSGATDKHIMEELIARDEVIDYLDKNDDDILDNIEATLKKYL